MPATQLAIPAQVHPHPTVSRAQPDTSCKASVWMRVQPKTTTEILLLTLVLLVMCPVSLAQAQPPLHAPPAIVLCTYQAMPVFRHVPRQESTQTLPIDSAHHVTAPA